MRRPGFEADRIHQSSVEVKNKRIYASTASLHLYGLYIENVYKSDKILCLFPGCIVILLCSINQQNVHFIKECFIFFDVFYMFRTRGFIFRKTVVYAVMVW